MAPGHIHKSRLGCAKGNGSESAPEKEDLSCPPTVIQPPKGPSAITAIAKSSPPKDAQDPSTSLRTLTTRPVTRTQKTKHSVEAKDPQAPPQDQARGDSPSAIIPVTTSGEQIDTSQSRGEHQPEHCPDGHSKKRRRLKLSKKNLETLQSQLDSTSTRMDRIFETQSEMGSTKRKRAASTRSGLPQNSTTGTKSSTSALYRYEILHDAQIYINHAAPPDIQAQVNDIFNRIISDRGRSEVSSMAKRMSNKFAAIVQEYNRETDCANVFIAALKALVENTALAKQDDMFRFVEQSDWTANLKPPRLRGFDIKHPVQANDEAGETSASPAKRQLTDLTSDPSLEKPQNDVSSIEQHSGIKTPRPDCVLGFFESMMVQELLRRGLSMLHAKTFLVELQRAQLLYSDPTENTKIRFPTLVFEAKAYATGQTAFDAENQAAVSGSCMINLLQQLTGVFDRYVPNFSRGKEVPLAFSVTSWGALLQLWVHYPLVEGNLTSYHMSLVKTCYATETDDVDAFLLLLAQLLSWIQGDFLTKLMDHLFVVAQSLLTA